MHDAFRLAGRAGRIEQLHDVVGLRAAPGERVGVAALGTIATEQDLLEALSAFPADDQHAFEMRQFPLHRPRQRGMVEPAELARNDEEFAFGKAEHELHFALPKNRHHRVHDGADPHACQDERGELPPVRQLTGDHVVFPDAESAETERNPVDARCQLAVAQSGLTPCH